MSIESIVLDDYAMILLANLAEAYEDYVVAYEGLADIVDREDLRDISLMFRKQDLLPRQRIFRQHADGFLDHIAHIDRYSDIAPIRHLNHHMMLNDECMDVWRSIYRYHRIKITSSETFARHVLTQYRMFQQEITSLD